MKLSKDRFDAWAASVWQEEKYSSSKIPNLAGISATAFYVQRRKDYMEASIVVALARGLGLNPLTELLKFEEFAVFSQKVEPTPEEVLSQVPPDFLMDELVGRCRHQEVEHYLMAMPEDNGLRRWLAAVDMRGHYAVLAEAAGLASSKVFAEKVQKNRVTLGQLAAICEHANLNGRLALVITGFMTFEEVGYPWNLREKVLESSPGLIVMEALWEARTYLEQTLGVKEIEASVFKHLG